MTRLLSLFGLTHPALDNSTDWEAKYKQAVADLEKQAGEIAKLREANSSLASGNALLSKENIAIRSGQHYGKDHPHA